MKRFKLISISLLAALLPLFFLLPTATGILFQGSVDSTPIPKSPEDGIRNVLSTSSGLSFNLSNPAITIAGDGKVLAKGLQETTEQPGAPELPYFSTLIVLPPELDVEVTVRTSSPVVSKDIAVAPVPQPQIADSLGFEPQAGFALETGPPELIPDPMVYLKDEVYPEQPFHLSDPFYVRDLRLIRLSLFPVSYNPLTKELANVQEMDVDLSFVGEQASITRPAPSKGDQHLIGLESQVLNSEFLNTWRSLPLEMQATDTALPIGTQVIKIEVDEDGIYELTRDQLAAAGMNVDTVNPQTFEMMYRGDPVAYQFIGDGDADFEINESLRFYGWAFNGSRLDKQFVTNNVFWLWAGGTPSLISTMSSLGTGDTVNSVLSSVTREPELSWFPSYTDKWDEFPNEPDAWYWELIPSSASAATAPITRTYLVTVPYPAPTGPDAQFTAEFSSYYGDTVQHSVAVSMNEYLNGASVTWWGARNENVVGSVPLNTVVDGPNEFLVILDENNPNCPWCTALNRITVDYQRQLIAAGDQLIFGDEVGGQRQFPVSGFNEGDPAQVKIWNITNARLPVEVLSNTIQISGGSPYIYTFATNHPADSKFIATTLANTLAPVAISSYTPIDLNPLSGGADWVAISYGEFITETQRLATHRANSQYGGLSTHIVDVEDVINQFGYGLPIPSDLSDYLSHALSSWDPKPGYAMLVGDSTRDPRHLRASWTDEQYVPTDLVFVDPWQGQIPSDLPYTLLSGNDLFSDISLGRIPAKAVADVTIAVDKIILYEQNQLQSYGWMENLAFVADATGPAGNFCDQNKDVINFYLPDYFNSTEICRDDYSGTSSEINTAMRNDMFTAINDSGATILNYKGHGSISGWSTFLSTSDINKWENTTRPVVVITGNCLDGHFTRPPEEGLGETLLRGADLSSNGVAAAAHWGSSGLGLSNHHSALIQWFYDGQFDKGLTAIGDAVTYAKTSYGSGGTSMPSLLYSFILQGDPAMQLMRPSLKLEHSAQQTAAHINGFVTYTIDVDNFGVYPSHISVTQEMPAGFQFINATSSVNVTADPNGNSVEFNLQYGQGSKNKGMPRNGSATITVTAQLDNSVGYGIQTSEATVTGMGMEAWPGDETDSADVYVLMPRVWIPSLIK